MATIDHKALYPNTTQYPNWLIDQVMGLLTGNEWKVLSYIVRRTYGWRKDSDTISLSQISQGNGKLSKETRQAVEIGTGIRRQQTISAALRVLCEGTNLVIRKRTGRASVFRLNLDASIVDLAWLEERASDRQASYKGNAETNRPANFGKAALGS